MTTRADEALRYSSRILERISKEKLGAREVERLVSETNAGLRDKPGHGHPGYPGSVPPGHTAREWGGEGGFSYLTGNNYLDCLGGYGNLKIGSYHPAVVEAVKKTISLSNPGGRDLFEALRAGLAKLFEMIIPGSLLHSSFTGSGTEAVEHALRLARIHTGRTGVIAAVGGYHGATRYSPGPWFGPGGARPVSGNLPAPFLQHVPFGDADFLKKTMESSFAVGFEVGAVILEPIQGESGVTVPPDDYFLQVRETCDHFETLFIADEVQTGMGRTGKLFAIEHFGVIPDIICFGNGLGGEVIPMGACFSRPEIWRENFDDPLTNPANRGISPQACAAALAAVQAMLGEGLVEKAAEKGSYILPLLERIGRKYPVLNRIQGKGLLIGLEFGSVETRRRVTGHLFEHGILAAGTLIRPEVLRIEPALAISIDEIDVILEVLEKAIRNAESH